jgi:hypothetical protein
VAIHKGSLHFLFENKGSMYDGKGFEMLAVLNQHCRPVWECLTAVCKALSLADAKGKGTDGLVIRS